MTTVNTNNKEIFVPLNEKIIDSKESPLKLIKSLAQVSVFRPERKVFSSILRHQ